MTTTHIRHSTADLMRYPDCEQCKSIAEFEANPPVYGPRPNIYTEADLCDGTDAVLAAMRREFHAYHIGGLAYPADFLDKATVAVATRTIGRKYASAKRGELVLLVPRKRPETGSLAGTVSLWCPRSMMMTAARPEWIKEA